ncbi:hypothetical protein CEP53_000298 [Fusarium sp. AF-6]|nr:hypothetical protein CEP53_000298 [Fusarium sp. AF-6]
MSDSNEERVNLFDTAIGSIKHYTYDGSFFVRAEKVTAETVGIPPDEWDAILSQDSKNRQQPPVTTLNERALSTKALYKPIQGDYETPILEINPGSGNETLRGTLHHCWLDGDRLALHYARQWGVSTSDFTTPICYTALSYTWGPPVFEATIECDGHAKRITSGLEAALKQFRQPHDSIMMWIDQICINQDDEAEKKKQIPLMGRIYERARSTVIWLGEAGNGSSSALKLIERITSILHFTLSEVDMKSFQRIGLPVADSHAWKELWDLLARPWFTRVWIIQEAILSSLYQTWFACGDSFMPWNTLTTACCYLETCGISRKLHEKFGPGLKQQRDICEVVWNLDNERSDYKSGPAPTLFKLLTKVRNSKCWDSRDRIYGLLGVCEGGDKEAVMKNDRIGSTAVDLYINMTTHHLFREPKIGMRLTTVLAALDHESSDLPSWVPDWRVPPRMYPLGEQFAHSVYQASGPFSKIMLRERESNKPIMRINDEKNELTIQGVFFDTLIDIGTLFTNPDLSNKNPTTENQTLLEAVAFVSQLKQTGSEYNVFTALWKSLVAGKNGDGKLRSPESFAEVFSFLLDQTTGKSPSVLGQTYSIRQKRPRGKGGLELSSLETRTLGQTFQE